MIFLNKQAIFISALLLSVRKNKRKTALTLAFIMTFTVVSPLTAMEQEPVGGFDYGVEDEISIEPTTPSAITATPASLQILTPMNMIAPANLDVIDRGTYHINIVAGNQVTTRRIANKSQHNLYNQTFFRTDVEHSGFMLNYEIISRAGTTRPADGSVPLVNFSQYNLGGITQWEIVNPASIPAGITINFQSYETIPGAYGTGWPGRANGWHVIGESVPSAGTVT